MFKMVRKNDSEYGAPVLPTPGCLIRPPGSAFVNLVLEVRPAMTPHRWDASRMVDDLEVHSVRHIKLYGGERGARINGERVRPFMWRDSGWIVVREYDLVPHNNTEEVEAHLAAIEGKNLYYVPEE